MSWPGQQYSNCEMDPPVSELTSYGSVSRLEQTMFAERLLEAGVLLPGICPGMMRVHPICEVLTLT